MKNGVLELLATCRIGAKAEGATVVAAAAIGARAGRTSAAAAMPARRGDRLKDTGLLGKREPVGSG
jgi:hypothetical protein